MILLDTNVLSELMRAPVAAAVERWAARQRIVDLHTSSISQAEILSGLETMPNGKRRDALIGSAQNLFDIILKGRVIAFDTAAARAYARVVSTRRRAGRPIGAFDAQIAAIALANEAMLATRNIRDFEDCGVRVIDPWAA